MGFSFLQGHGMVLYATDIAGRKLAGGATLDFGGPVHDYAHVSHGPFFHPWK